MNTGHDLPSVAKRKSVWPLPVQCICIFIIRGREKPLSKKKKYSLKLCWGFTKMVPLDFCYNHYLASHNAR